MQARGVLNRLPMFIEILEDGIRWPDGTVISCRCNPLVYPYFAAPSIIWRR
jgi:hypothetical protein